ncbi:unnamed protein product [Prunus armeniaca]
MRCPDEDRVRLASFLLKGNAYHWWKTVRRGYVDPTTITWAEFQHIFYEQFYPHSYRNAKKVEFLQLKQGSMSMLEYEHKFNELSGFAPELIPNEEEKCRRFEEGLWLDIQAVVIVTTYPTMRALVQAADRVSKKLSAGSARRLRLGILHGRLAQPVTTVDRLDTLEVIAHILYRAVVQVRGVVLVVSIVVRFGTLKVSALFSLSVILQGRKLWPSKGKVVEVIVKVRVVPLLRLQVLHPIVGFSLPSVVEVVDTRGDKVFRDSYVQVGDAVLEANLIPLDLVDLDVILGMEWLEKHHASVDCFRNEVILRSPGQLEVTFRGERRVLPSFLISVITVRWLLKKRCVGYLAHIIDTREVTVNLEDVPVVREFLDVFPDDHPVLTPHGETELIIELLPRTNPIY